MSIANAASIATHTQLETPAATKAATHAKRAERDLRSLLGRQLKADEVTFDDDLQEYDRIVALGEEDDDYKMLLEAESIVAGAFALPFLNVRATERGGLISAVGFNESRQELLFISQVKRYQLEWRQQAHELMAPFTEGGRTGERAFVL